MNIQSNKSPNTADTHITLTYSDADMHMIGKIIYDKIINDLTEQVVNEAMKQLSGSIIAKIN